MKKSVYLVCIVITMLTACRSERSGGTGEIPVQDLSVSTLNDYNAVVSNQLDLMGELLSKGSLRAKEEGVAEPEQQDVMAQMTVELLAPSKTYLSDLGVSTSDIYHVYDKTEGIDHISDTDIVGLALFLNSYFTAQIAATEISEDPQDPDTTNGSNKAIDCLVEAAGVTTGITIIRSLTKGTLSKAAVKAAVKLAAKVGSRTLSGIGLALVAAEFTYCMFTSSSSDYSAYVPFEESVPLEESAPSEVAPSERPQHTL